MTFLKLRSVYSVVIVISFLSAPVVTLASPVPLILSYSGVTQGNGYNWAATMAFIAETLEALADDADKIQSRDARDVKIHISGFAGGSSGSSIAMVFDALTSNPSILSIDSLKTQIISRTEARRLASSFRFIAKGTDFKVGLSVSTIARVLGEQGKSLGKMGLSLLPDVQDYLAAQSIPSVPKLWIHQMDGRVVLSDFGRMVYFARTFDARLLLKKISQQNGYTRWKFQMRLQPALLEALEKMTFIQDDLNLSQTIEASQQKSVEALALKFVDWQEASIKEIMEKDIRSRVGEWADFRRRFRSAMTPENHSVAEGVAQPGSGVGGHGQGMNAFRAVLGETMKAGYFAVALAKPVDDWMTVIKEIRQHKKIDYKDLRAYILMTKESAGMILNSPIYQNAIRASDPFLSRYIIAVVDQRWSSMNISAREPQLVDELIGNLNADNIRIREIYDPQKDSQKRFKMIDIRKTSNPGGIIVIGGFPYQPISAMLPVIYHQVARQQLKTKYPEYEIRPVQFTFQKDQPMDSMSQFPVEMLSTKLNILGTHESAQLNIADFLAWTRAGRDWYFQIVRNEGGEVYELRSNWGIKTLPAQLIGYGDMLYTLTVIDVKSQLQQLNVGNSQRLIAVPDWARRRPSN